MSRITVASLGQIGAVPDRKGYLIPPNAFIELLNVRPTKDGLESFGGSDYETYFTLRDPTDAIKGEPLYKFHSSTNYWYFGTGTKLWVTDGTTYTDISKSGGTYSVAAGDSPWQGTLLNGVPIYNFEGLSAPQYGSATSPTTAMQDLPNWPPSHLSSMSCKVIRAFKSYLVALDITEDGTNYSNMVRWSHFADPGAVPSGSEAWDETDATSEAGRTVLSETEGSCMDCETLGNTNIIYKSDGAWAMEFIGPPFIFRFSKIFGMPGIMARGCVANTPKGHFFLSRNDLMVYSGSGAPTSIAEERVRRKVFNEIDPDNAFECYVAHNVEFDEVWFCYPDGNQTNGCNKAAVFNYTLNNWSFRELPETTGWSGGRVTAVSGDDSWDTGPDVTWNSTDNPWDAFVEGTKRRLVMPSYKTAQLHTFDEGWTEGDTPSGASPWTAETSELFPVITNENLSVDAQDQQGQPKANPGQRILLNRLWLLAEPLQAGQTPELTFSVNSRDSLNAAESLGDSASFTLAIGTDNQLPIIAEGRYLSLDIRRNDDDTTGPFRIASLEYEIMPTGEF